MLYMTKLHNYSITTTKKQFINYLSALSTFMHDFFHIKQYNQQLIQQTIKYAHNQYDKVQFTSLANKQ